VAELFKSDLDRGCIFAVVEEGICFCFGGRGKDGGHDGAVNEDGSIDGWRSFSWAGSCCWDFVTEIVDACRLHGSKL
jgi:hypothetical protein